MSNSHSSQSLQQVLWSTWINWGAFRITFGKEHSNCILRNPPFTPYGRPLSKTNLQSKCHIHWKLSRCSLYCALQVNEVVVSLGEMFGMAVVASHGRNSVLCVVTTSAMTTTQKRWNLISDNRMHARHICAKSQTEYQSWLTKIG